MKGECARGLQLCSSRAATSLPTPAGPVINNRLPVAATFLSVARTLLIATEVPVSSSAWPNNAFSEAFSCRSLSVSVALATKWSSFSASKGFSRKSTAPDAIAATAVSILPCPENTMTGICLSRCLIAFNNSNPSIEEPRNQTSNKISDGRRSSSAANAASDVDAVRVP